MRMYNAKQLTDDLNSSWMKNIFSPKTNQNAYICRGIHTKNIVPVYAFWILTTYKDDFSKFHAVWYPHRESEWKNRSKTL